MLFKATFTAALLALGVNAAPVADPVKTFNFEVVDPKQGTYYLADATGLGTKDVAKALVCSLAGDVIQCGGKGFPAFPANADMVQLATSGNSTGWSVDATTGAINWSAKPNMKFSIGIGSATAIWAEVCPHHNFAHGTAKAAWIAA